MILALLALAGAAPTPQPWPYAADFSRLLEAPAGRHGFLRAAPDGRFRWADGRRARFWGVNISNRSLWVSRAEIDRAIDDLARSGCNMIRFEAIDSTGGITETGPDTSRRLHPQRLDALDYWFARARARGIYTHLNLLDFRQFREGDGVANAEALGRAARPYAIFDPRLQELQREFARDLLTHRNTYTGLRYVDDPALALVEICNEHGFFLRTASLETMVEPYAGQLRSRWNRWLLARYGSRDALRRAWGPGAPGDEEDPAAGGVMLPNLTPGTGPRREPGRVSDGVRFLSGLQREHFAAMRGWLRQIGLRAPVSASVSTEIVPDLYSAAGMDFTTGNYYADHPAFSGGDWQGSYFFNDRNPLRTDSIFGSAPWMAALRWAGKPVVIREWAVVWPNRYRASAMPEIAAYAALQDVDAVLLFGYKLGDRSDRLQDFGHQLDPVTWGLFGQAALTFLRGDVQPARREVRVQHAAAGLFGWPSCTRAAHGAAWFVRVSSAVGPSPPARSARPPGSPGRPLIVSPGRPPRRILADLAAAGAPLSRAMLPEGILLATTGEIMRDTRRGRLIVETPRSASISGEFKPGEIVRAGGFAFRTDSPIGALMITALDDLPLARSSHWLARWVSRAHNAGEALVPAAPGAPSLYRLQTWGEPPISTDGRPCPNATILQRAGRPILTLQLINGGWELEVRDGLPTLRCDTPAITGALLGRPIVTDPAGVGR